LPWTRQELGRGEKGKKGGDSSKKRAILDKQKPLKGISKTQVDQGGENNATVDFDATSPGGKQAAWAERKKLHGKGKSVKEEKKKKSGERKSQRGTGFTRCLHTGGRTGTAPKRRPQKTSRREKNPKEKFTRRTSERLVEKGN